MTGIKLDADNPSPQTLGRDERRAAPRERIEYDLT